MALLEPFMVKTDMSGNNSSLELEADTGESFLVKGVRSGALGTEEFHELILQTQSVGWWYAGDIDANHLGQWDLASLHPNVLERLIELDILNGYPIAEGQKLSLVRQNGGNVKSAFIYEKYDAGDITPDMQNGTEATEFVFLNYGTNSGSITSPNYGELDKTRNPVEYPDFPFGKDVPSGVEIDIIGILLMDWRDAAGNLHPNYSYLKLTQGRNVLFDEDRNGIYVREGMGLLTWGPCRQTNVDVSLLPEPRTFTAGEELTVEINAGADLAAEDVNMALIERVRSV